MRIKYLLKTSPLPPSKGEFFLSPLLRFFLSPLLPFSPSPFLPFSFSPFHQFFTSPFLLFTQSPSLPLSSSPLPSSALPTNLHTSGCRDLASPSSASLRFVAMVLNLRHLNVPPASSSLCPSQLSVEHQDSLHRPFQ